MQTMQQRTAPAVDSGFEPIPTRIKEVPPLIIEKQDVYVKQQVTGHLRQLSTQLALVHRAAAEAYLSQCMYGEALPHAEAAATFDLDNAEYQNQLGFIRYILGDDAGAIACFEKVLAEQPAQPDALFNLGMVRFGCDDVQAAEQCFSSCLAVNPNDAETWNNRGVCLHRLGRSDDARACFQRALQIDPSNQDAKINLSSTPAR